VGQDRSTTLSTCPFGRFVPLNTHAGYGIFWANYPIHGAEFVAISPTGAYRDLIPADLRGLGEAAVDAALMRRGIGFVVEDPLWYAGLRLSQGEDYFRF
jgi:hypothetical protein